MVVMAGLCEFTEANNRARIFALCQLQDDPVLVPVSAAGETTIRGVRSTQESHKLQVRIDNLPGGLVRAYIGLSVPGNHDLTEGSFVLNAKIGSAAAQQLVLPRPQIAGNRYALMAVMVRSGGRWGLARLPQGPEYYADRTALSVVHPTPSWWSRRRS